MTAAPLWTADAAAAATGGRATADFAATGISIDTRTLEAGDLFVALAGPNFDGHRFVASAFASGAAAALVSRDDLEAEGPVVVVADTMDGLRALAVVSRARTDAKIAAITGSVGKTGTKEALAHVLSQQGSVSASRSSLNNHWGVPLSLARMPADTDFGVFEIGMNHAGEITPLVGMVRPHVAVVTAIAPAHMAFFDSVEDIARAKGEIFSGFTDGGTAIINRDTEYFDLLADMAHAAGAGAVVSFGRNPKADVRLMEAMSTATGTEIDATWYGDKLSFRVEQPGVHWAYNGLAVLAAAVAMGADLTEAAAALATLPAIKGRGALHTLPWGDGEIRLIDDAYNANPESMRAALDTLGGYAPNGGRRVAIIGDMLELGDGSEEAHAGLAAHLDRNEVDLVFLAGTEIRALADRLSGKRIGGMAEDWKALFPMVTAGLRAGDVVTVKASHGIGLEDLVAALLDNASGGSSPTSSSGIVRNAV
jgi:UDP-N-acetylmuramoyl-tripeptide--D-alanyl-D-alanine ligase